MKKIRGRVETINGSHFWYDKNDNPHRLDEMGDQYIKNCINLLVDRGARYDKNGLPKIDQSAEILTLKEEFMYRETIKQTSVGRLIYA